MEIRQITAEERTATMWPLQAYAFLASPGSDEQTEAYSRRTRYFESSLSLIAEEDGRALACVGAFPMRQNLRGVVHDMAGVASVASHPDARRRGLVRELLQRLLRQKRDDGCSLSALYPFRPSFYAKFGFVGLPRVRIATFGPEGLSHLLRADLPGSVQRLPMRDAFDEYTALTHRLLGERHGFAVFDEIRNAEFRESKRWVALARDAAGEAVGAVSFTIDEYGGSLTASDMLTTGPLGRALLLQFFARHVDQVAKIEVTVGTDEVPELWATDLAVVTEGRATFPSTPAPMARVLDLTALAGTPIARETTTAQAITIEVVDDELIGGTYTLACNNGHLAVDRGGNPTATLTAAGLSGLAYGVLDPIDVITRGLGRIGDTTIDPLRALFPKEMPYLFADF